jgi:hypothetical protein
MTKAELLKALEPFADDVEILAGGAPAVAYYLVDDHVAYINIEDMYSQRDDIGEIIGGG